MLLDLVDVEKDKLEFVEVNRIMYELQPLRFKAGWRIECNNFTEYDIGVHSKRDCYELHEDLLQLFNEKANLIIDLGWYPNYDENGNYILLLIKNYDWDYPLEKIVSKSKSEIVEYIEKWINWTFWRKYDE
ncbi:hypothetical protein [Gemelliphila palaticanis]|uniref:Uncharacterized protein n=1 Tax=Gemelliphila palaticanis TaxID=81950 RepID=A0ABX2T1U2_9BACL|nr:hypothetical protein [Gemella palaticanis]MBF0715692.1 hypothetical protein [Gemella palaticanis]NYS47622.1 hypothetical protein [Gemella palaticanis]